MLNLSPSAFASKGHRDSISTSSVQHFVLRTKKKILPVNVCLFAVFKQTEPNTQPNTSHCVQPTAATLREYSTPDFGGSAEGWGGLCHLPKIIVGERADLKLHNKENISVETLH